MKIKTGEIILPNGDIAVTAQGKYLKVPIEHLESNLFPASLRPMDDLLDLIVPGRFHSLGRAATAVDVFST